MNVSRRHLLMASGAALASAMQGCATTNNPDARHRYTESVSGVYVSVDHKLLVVLGSDYHYVFDMPAAIDKTLSSGFHEYVKAVFDQGFGVDRNGAVTGKYILRMSADAPEAAQKSAIAAGYEFEATRSVGNTSLSREYSFQYRGTLMGKRYAANGVRPPSTNEKLNQTYQISVVEELPTRYQSAGSPSTPVTVGNDGAGILFGVLLIVPMAIAIGIGSATGKFP